MNSILERPGIRQHLSSISVSQYHRQSEGDDDRRTELLRGFVFLKVVPSPRHSLVVQRLSKLASASTASGEHVRQEQPLTLTDSEPQPDVAIVSGGLDDYGRTHPATALLVMEVSLSTEERDREKISIYAEAGIGEYWLVFPGEVLIEVHAAPLAGRYTRMRVYRAGETVASEALPSLEVKLDELFQV